MNRIFVQVDGRAWRSMRCEFCGSTLEHVDEFPNRRRHPFPPQSKRLLQSDAGFDPKRKCPNVGKLFEFPCAVEGQRVGATCTHPNLRCITVAVQPLEPSDPHLVTHALYCADCGTPFRYVAGDGAIAFDDSRTKMSVLAIEEGNPLI